MNSTPELVHTTILELFALNSSSDRKEFIRLITHTRNTLAANNKYSGFATPLTQFLSRLDPSFHDSSVYYFSHMSLDKPLTRPELRLTITVGFTDAHQHHPKFPDLHKLIIAAQLDPRSYAFAGYFDPSPKSVEEL
jgi:hypothetical protein